MTTRRAFLKSILGLGALVLPWTGWPGKLLKGIQSWAGSPPVRLDLPAAPAVRPQEGEIKDVSADIMRDITTLAGRDFQGRKAGSIGEVRAADYIMNELRSLGIKPMGDNRTNYLHAFTIPPVTENVVNGRLTFTPGEHSELRTPSANILGGLVGDDSENMIMISAHYDHLGIFEGQIYPGANDNASGVACILTVMRRLVLEKVKLKHTIVAAFWSAEEMGFVGSHAFVQNPTFPLEKVKAVINVDTVGNGKTGEFAIWADRSNIAVKAVQAAAEGFSASVPIVPQAGHNSDQISFTQAGVPALTLMAKEWLAENHTIKDTPDFIRLDQVKLASEIVYRAILSLEG